MSGYFQARREDGHGDLKKRAKTIQVKKKAHWAARNDRTDGYHVDYADRRAKFGIAVWLQENNKYTLVQEFDNKQEAQYFIKQRRK